MKPTKEQEQCGITYKEAQEKMKEMELCEFCSKEADTEGTSMTGSYCIDCLRLTCQECSDAIKKLQKRMPKNIRKITTKEQYDDALNGLVRG